MSALAKSLLAAALTLPLVAFVAGVLAAPDAPEPDRSRPVIIGQVGDDTGDDVRESPPRDRRERRDRDRPPDRDDDPPRPGGVVTPAPRDLADDDDGVGDDDDDDDTTRATRPSRSVDD